MKEIIFGGVIGLLVTAGTVNAQSDEDIQSFIARTFTGNSSPSAAPTTSLGVVKEQKAAVAPPHATPVGRREARWIDGGYKVCWIGRLATDSITRKKELALLRKREWEVRTAPFRGNYRLPADNIVIQPAVENSKEVMILLERF